MGLLVFFVLVGASYALASPYAAVADEPAHLVKALGTGHGDPFGRPVADGRPTVLRDLSASALERQRVYIASTSRSFHFPTRLARRRGDTDQCFVLQPRRPASCPPPTTLGEPARNSYVGVYPPLSFAAPGLATRLVSTRHAALFAGRLANGLVCTLLLGLAVAALGGGARRPLGNRAANALPLAGLAVVLWPSALVLAWALNPNGVEILAAVAFFATLLRLVRPEDPPRWVWFGIAASGFVLSSSRPVAPLYTAFGLLMAVLLVGPAFLMRRIRVHPRRAVGTAIVLALGVVGTAVVDKAMGVGMPPDSQSATSLIAPALRQLPQLIQGSVTQLGWGEIRLPQILFRGWYVLLIGLWLCALVVGNRRQRVACLVLPAVFVGLEVAFVIVAHPSGFPLGGRYLSAGLCALPMLWVEVLYLNRHRLRPWFVAAVLVVLTAGVAITQVDAWYLNGRRFAVGVSGAAGYLTGGAAWLPPGGWLLWAAIALLGVLSLLAGTANDMRPTGEVTAPPDRSAIARRPADRVPG